jgi:hypothetical protein
MARQSGSRASRVAWTAPEDGNQRFKYLLGIGQTGINMDADVPTQKQRGVHAVFTPGTRQDALLNTIKSII